MTKTFPVKVKIDRPKGSRHPKFCDLIYPVNYGFVEGIMGGDGQEQDVYVLGVDEPISDFEGIVIAIIHRNDDVEEKWVAAPDGIFFSEEQIAALVEFQEKYFDSEIILLQEKGDNMDKKISPSIMCVDFFALGQTLRAFEECAIEYIHVDIMDGHFVPNFTLGTDFIKALKKNTKIPLDIHLMIEDPEEKLSWFEFGDGDIVSVHYESTEKLAEAIDIIKNRGAKAYVAINPETDESVLDDYLSDIDGVLVMTVRPGFAGQKMIPETLEKIARVREELDSKGLSHISIEVDGNVSFENARLMNEKGADIFVAGTSSVFSKDGSLFENTEKMRKIIV